MKKFLPVIIIFSFCAFTNLARAGGLPDADSDGVSDETEINIYATDPKNADSDGDGYSDWEELNKGFSPHVKDKKLEENDLDKDGLNDRMELNFHTKLDNPDTDGDGHNDGEEIDTGFDPLDKNEVKLKKKIKVDLSKQELHYFLGHVRLGIYKISSGKKSTPTPIGNYKVINKSPKAWSSYGLWMPYWLGLGTGKFGFHELPIWPNGYREGENHLGVPVSHGCIRLGIGPAKFLYNWAEIGTEVAIN